MSIMQNSVEWLLPLITNNPQDLKKSNLASIRLRAAICLDILKENKYEVLIGDAKKNKNASTLMVGKVDYITDPERSDRWLNYIYSAKRNGSHIVIDYTDHHLETGTAADFFYEAAFGMADLVICSSIRLSKLIIPYYKGDTKIIEDPVEIPIRPPALSNNKTKTALWFGHSSNLPYLFEFLGKDYALSNPTRLVVMTNAPPLVEKYKDVLSLPNLLNLEVFATPWSLKDMIKVASICDVCWLPAGVYSKRKAGASSNRLLTALALGLPVAADELESYLPFRQYFSSLRTSEFSNLMDQPHKFFESVKSAQSHIAQNYTKEIIARQWLDALNSLSRT